MAKPEAFIFDLNGTMVDDMQYHNIAWHSILNEDLKANLTREEVAKQMYGKNEELLDRVFGKGHFTPEQIARISEKKERSYQAAFKPHLQLIKGLPAFLEKAQTHNIKMAIGSAAIPFNIDFVLDNLGLRHYFTAIVSADEVAISKPDPETFLLGAKLLNANPKNCIVFEDAPKGVEAALRAEMPCIVLTTMHEKEEFHRYPNVLRYIADYTDPSIEELFK
ncbi:HAD family phosphatase [Puia sp.]|jgi:beta-phosphoglucomutase family hydrolase|uniref:HAD family hydrolase n=1 Tax=Puia sp. TaxID=2045100 RepID=UPI002F3EFA8E